MFFVPTVRFYSWEFYKRNYRPHKCQGDGVFVFCNVQLIIALRQNGSEIDLGSQAGGGWEGEKEMHYENCVFALWGLHPLSENSCQSSHRTESDSISGANICLLLKLKERKMLHVLVPGREAQENGS